MAAACDHFFLGKPLDLAIEAKVCDLDTGEVDQSERCRNFARKQAYDAKQAEKAERLQQRSEKAKQRANNLANRANSMASIIPFGQPILCGHHSEGRDRRYRAKIHNTYVAANEEQKKAEHYARRAAAKLNNEAIFSDDPAATEKLSEKIERLEARQTVMKATNKALKIKDVVKGNEALSDLGFSEESIQILRSQKLTRLKEFSNILVEGGFHAFSLTNNQANIRRLKERLEKLEKLANLEETIIQGSIARFEDHPQDNRVRLFYPGKPDEETRKRLKGCGFRWAPSEGAWQAYRNRSSIYYARKEAGIGEVQTDGNL